MSKGTRKKSATKTPRTVDADAVITEAREQVRREHDARLATAIEAGRKNRDERRAQYAALVKERHDCGRVTEASLLGVIAHAAGSCEFDPLLAILQEIQIRARTLQAAVHEGEEAVDARTLGMELHMLERRAEAAMEIVARSVNVHGAEQ